MRALRKEASENCFIPSTMWGRTKEGPFTHQQIGPHWTQSANTSTVDYLTLRIVKNLLKSHQFYSFIFFYRNQNEQTQWRYIEEKLSRWVISD